MCEIFSNNTFVFKIAINFCKSFRYTWESCLFPSFSSLEQFVQSHPFVEEKNGGLWSARTCWWFLSRAGAEPVVGAIEWSIIESLCQHAPTVLSPANATFCWKATKQGCLKPNILFWGLSLSAASLLHRASCWPVNLGLLFGFVWRRNSFLAAWLLMQIDLQWVLPLVFWACLGMPDSWDEHNNLISQAETHHTCFVQTWLIYARLLNYSLFSVSVCVF